MNSRRAALVDKAFDKLDVSNTGEVTIGDIESLYDASQHPDVLAGTKSAREVLREYMSMWDTHDRDGVVTREEFHDYYADLSACIDTDEYFEAMMRSAWHFDDDDSEDDYNYCVVVTHYNGMQDEVQMTQEAGVHRDDVRGIKEYLESQGLTSIKRVWVPKH